jgi:DNA-binding transcriptional LysR family regulator
VTLNQLRAFLAACRSGTFTGAAQDLGISQASVSELIRRLEEEFRVPLFTRAARSLVLTSAAEALIPHAEKTLAAAEGAEQTLKAVHDLSGGVASFGVLRNADYYLLTDLAIQFHLRHPEVQMRLVGLNSAQVATEVAEGRIEAGIVVLPIDDAGLQVVPIGRDEVVYASADRAKVAEPVRIETVCDSRLVLYDAHVGWRDPTRSQLLQRAQVAGMSLNPWIEVEQVEAALKLVSRGIGDTFLSKTVSKSPACPPGVHTNSFSEPMYDTLAFIKRNTTVLSSATDELARLALQILRRNPVLENLPVAS